VTINDEVCVGRHMSALSVHNGLKQGNALSLSLFGFGLEYAIMKAKEDWKGLELNGTHQFLVHAVSDNLVRKG
jgi:hypothetical protein